MIKLSYFPNLFIEAAVLFDQQGGCLFLRSGGILKSIYLNEDCMKL